MKMDNLNNYGLHQNNSSSNDNGNGSEANREILGSPDSETSTSMLTTLTEILDISEAQMTCSICSDIMNNPTTVACGHTFCTGCIEDWFQTKENCPCCRKSCLGGEHSKPVAPISEYLKKLKPLITFRQNHRISQNLGKLLNHSDQAQLHKLMSDRILSMKSEEQYNSLDAALALVKCAVATGASLDKIEEDIGRLVSSPGMVLDKYMRHETLQDPNYHYAPLVRRRKIELKWPNNRSWFQIAAVLFIGFVCYHSILGLEQEGFSIVSEPLLRALSLLNVYIDLLDYFR